MIPPNPQIDCGNDPACSGGCDCSDCPDEMPPGFVLSIDASNGTCSECDLLDGTVLLQDNSFSGCCVYDVGSTICGPWPIGLSFSETRVKLEVFENDPVIYEANRVVGEPCNKAWTLTKVSGTGTECIYPDAVSVTPSDANGDVAPACNNTVPTECCDAVPKSLVAAFAQTGGDTCSCVDGASVPLEYDLSSEYWIGNADGGCPAGSLWVRLECSTSAPLRWILTWNCGADASCLDDPGASFASQESFECGPLVVGFTDFAGTECCLENNQDWDIDVTE